jgi:hypothetical protein
LARGRLDVVRVDSGLDRRGDEIFMGKRLERLCLERPPQDLFDLVSRVLGHA